MAERPVYLLAAGGHAAVVLDALLVEEVVAVDLWLWLQLAVNAAVALLHARGVPRHVEMEQVPAVGLEVQTFTGRIGGDQDADGMFGRLSLECPLDFLALRRRRGAVVDGDAFLPPLRSVNGLR